MKLQMTLEEEAKKYVNNIPNCKITEKLLWNEGGVLYSIVSADNQKKCLFATSLEDEKIEVKQLYYTIVEDSKNDVFDFIKCETIECKEVIQNGEIKGCYIFVLMEEVTPLIEMILERNFCAVNLNENLKKIKLLQAIIDACNIAEFVREKYPAINMFINNEELCVDKNGKTHLLLLDMIKNDICINNQASELKMILTQMAKGLGIKLRIKYADDTVSELRKACETEKERIEKLEIKYINKFEQNKENAAKNNVVSWYNLGYMYEKGRGTRVDYKEAAKWYEKAAEKKYVKALNNLAHMYQKGTGVEKDYTKAMEYLLKASKLKDSTAQFNLAIMYQTGKGVEKDMKKAKYWYKKSMKNGNKTAERMYMRIKSR